MLSGFITISWLVDNQSIHAAMEETRRVASYSRVNVLCSANKANDNNLERSIDADGWRKTTSDRRFGSAVDVILTACVSLSYEK